MEDQPAERRAALACGPHGGEGDGPEGEVEVGPARDDRGVVAPQLQERSAHPRGDGLADLAAHPGASRGRDQGEQPILGHRPADLGAAGAEGEHPGAAVGLGHRVSTIRLDRDRRERGLGRRLPRSG